MNQPTCECGCGKPVSIATRTDRRRGYVEGQPVRFAVGHSTRSGTRQAPGQCQAEGCMKPARHSGTKHCSMHASRLLRAGSLAAPRQESLIERIFRHVRQDVDCWVWTGYVRPDGYALVGVGRRRFFAHRMAYELMRADIPDGLVLDHLCRNRSCLNPWHLDPVPQRINVLRGESLVARQAAQTACRQGHEFTPDNTHVDKRGRRTCRICLRAKKARRRARKKMA